MLTRTETEQYSRHLLLPEIGKAGQERIAAARVLVAGAGGLGCAVLQYLAAAGTGTIGVVDFDHVELHNLPRQLLYTPGDIGKPKATAAKQHLAVLNPRVQVNAMYCRLQLQNAEEMIRGYDFVIDCSDNLETRYLINDACVALGKPFVSGAIYRFQGQLSVFNYQHGPTYRCAFPAEETTVTPASCSFAGVLNTLAGIVGVMQANEALKIITGAGEVCSGKLLLLDLLKNSFPEIQVARTVETHPA